MLAGLSPDTALGRVVAIRSEKDRETIKRFSKEQRRIYDDWRKQRTEKLTDEQIEKEMRDLELQIARVFGGG